LLLSIKKAVDRDRRPGRFLLTGCANLLLMRQVSESLAGRASYVTLWPMTRRERLGRGTAGVWDALLAEHDENWEDVFEADDAPPADWREEAVKGGYPVPAVHLRRTADRAVSGAHLENLVLHDLAAWRDARTVRAELSYWRTAAGEVVDLVVEDGGRLLPIEIKASARPRLADAAALRSFRAVYGAKARHGLLLHTGSKIERLAPDVLAVPWWRAI
jgi:predicted AAA+ superfamily ATPase